MKKRFCINGHDTLLFGRTRKYECRECRRLRKRYDNMTSEQIERERSRKELVYLEIVENPLRKLKRQTVDRISKTERKLNGWL